MTAHPTAAWTAQQIVEAFPESNAPRYLIRDRDGIYGNAFREKLKAMGIGEGSVKVHLFRAVHTIRKRLRRSP